MRDPTAAEYGAVHAVAHTDCGALLLEAAGTVNTGDTGGERTHDAQWA
jgi:hypothetical protein